MRAFRTQRVEIYRSTLRWKKLSEAEIQRDGLRFVKGDDVWFSAWYWLEGTSEASTVFLWDIEPTALRNTPGADSFYKTAKWSPPTWGNGGHLKNFVRPLARQNSPKIAGWK